MPVPSFAIRCTRKVLLAREVYELGFTKPEGFSFKAGQFVLFDVPRVGDPSDVQTRAFSIASSPSEESLLFLIKLKPGGRASRWVEEIVEVGTEVRIQGPFGMFLLDPASEKDYLFVATGAGIAPFRSQILDALEWGDRRRMEVVFGVRSEEDLFWTHGMEELAQKHENFFPHIALSDPSASWTGHRGRVQTLVPRIVKDVSTVSLYVCGNPDMTTELKALALGEWRLPKKDVHVEGYI